MVRVRGSEELLKLREISLQSNFQVKVGLGRGSVKGATVADCRIASASMQSATNCLTEQPVGWQACAGYPSPQGARQKP